MADQSVEHEGQPTRRTFLSKTAGVVTSVSLVGAVAPVFRRSANERADAWLAEKLQDRTFVESPIGGLVNEKGVSGYWSGGPGASAKTIYDELRGLETPSDPPSRPHDADDVGRCVELLDAVPEWRSRMGKMATVSPEWKGLARNWKAVESAYRAGRTKIVKRLIAKAVAVS